MYYPVPKFDFLAKKTKQSGVFSGIYGKTFYFKFRRNFFFRPFIPCGSDYDYAPARRQVQRRIPACPKGKAGIKIHYFFIICKGIYSTISVWKMPSTAVR